jgi:hypothetical protein
MITRFATRTSLDSLRQQTRRKPNRGNCVPPKHSIHIEVESLQNDHIRMRGEKHVIKRDDREH